MIDEWIMIDKNGLRINVGIILVNKEGKLFWGKRSDKSDAWQFPQGGVQKDETPKQAMFRELYEELGLTHQDVKIIGETKNWLCYYLPRYLRRYRSKPLCIGQKQKWFLLRLISDEKCIKLDKADKQEFNEWQWVDHRLPVRKVIMFKRHVYKQVLKEFETLLC